ncbi:hypothetical protein ASPZODRAFT_147130 [Penicilliopsis zonata CBS 506.65]|uniref:Rad4 beta-hairpin domain-containing protein n=1 Tax=Penicilliopsis zonata CBS 506.65 TaxID=1073090 RepID=A0A1L9S6D4_9EURO|nr:hypothetical protein ASPZODRAFT_147130 [Penicilliopsis zonata CBS 506.65]OJJ42734.1 hypothetical protein ASPZODRAFT_147130 [Penicilliopsis zonata CBS 506.65]
MPPFVPRKRLSSEEPPPAKRPATDALLAIPESDADADSTSSLSEAPSDEFVDVNTGADTEGEGEGSNEGSDDEIDWEDAIDTTTKTTTAVATPAAEPQDLELTLDRDEVHVSDLLEGKKGPSKIERQIRTLTHCMHVQCLLFHNALRNAWASDAKLHEILRQKLPTGIRNEVHKWRVASGLEMPEEKPEEKQKGKKQKGRKKKSDRDWGDGSSRLEPGQPDLSRGDPIIHLLKVLTAYWRRQFQITAPGLRKQGYRPMAAVEAQIASLHKQDHDPEVHGERIRDRDEFRAVAEAMQGSRDVGAQLFTALLRALGIEARLVGSLQPLGFGWTKAETYAEKTQAASVNREDTIEAGDISADSEESSDSDEVPTKTTKTKGYDRDLPFPVYWTEVASPITHEIIPVDPLVLANAVATTPELQAAFEPRGARAERAKQVICYVVAHAADGTAKDVTTRYLRRRTWPGKTKGYRLPVEKIAVPGRRRKGQFDEYDWFRVTMRGYLRPEAKRTAVDETEDAKDLLPNQPDKKAARDGDTLQSLRTSAEYVLERFLRREEALRPGAEHVRLFTSGKGVKAKEEKVFRRADVLKCLSAESWHKEGRQVKVGEAPLKRVPIRAVTLLRKREVDELTRETGEKPLQGLYARHQTEYIIPPPIRDGIIPKNEYGNIDCFVPSMVPRGASHVPWPGTVRVCKKLGIDYAEAVTGFEFGSKMAVPVIRGVVVAAENESLLKDAWRVDDAEKRKREQLKAEKRILQTWRKFLFGLRIAERVREEYGGDDRLDDTLRDAHNPFTKSEASASRDGADSHHHDHGGGFLLADDDDHHPHDFGGGFLLPGEDGDADGLIVDHGKSKSEGSSAEEEEEEDDDYDEYEQPRRKR